jgi:hypothetical protein
MIINWNRLLKPLLNPVVFRLIEVAMGALIGLAAGLLLLAVMLAAAHLEVALPLSHEQRQVIVLAFTALGLVIRVLGQWRC